MRSLQIEEQAKDIQLRVGKLGAHIGKFEEYMQKLGNSLGTTVNHYNSAHKELAKVDKDVRVKDLKEEEVNRLREIVEKKYTVEGDLRREVQSNIKRLREINCYRGLRHGKHLPPSADGSGQLQRRGKGRRHLLHPHLRDPSGVHRAPDYLLSG